MKFRLLDLLACPIDKTFPLELIVLDEKKVVGETKEVKTPVCEFEIPDSPSVTDSNSFNRSATCLYRSLETFWSFP